MLCFLNGGTTLTSISHKKAWMHLVQTERAMEGLLWMSGPILQTYSGACHSRSTSGGVSITVVVAEKRTGDVCLCMCLTDMVGKLDFSRLEVDVEEGKRGHFLPLFLLLL